MEDKEEQVIVSVLEDLHIEEGESTRYPGLEEVEEILGYIFNEKSLLIEALTHGSYKESCTSYERLEFVGDSVLNLLIAKKDYFLYPDLPPGNLTRLRSANVDTEKLARAAVKIDLHKYLRHKKPLLDGQIREFMEAIKEYPLHSYGLIDAPKALADIVESTIGAIFIDSNSCLDTTWKVVKDLLEPIITPETLQIHPNTKLYEICQKYGYEVRIEDFWKERGVVEVFVNDEFVGEGIYKSKRLIAINRATHNAYKEIVRRLSVEHNEDQQVMGNWGTHLYDDQT